MRIIVLACLLALAACGNSEAEYDGTTTFAAHDAADADAGAITEDEALDAATDEMSSETYVSVGEPYGCTSDCSGHDAGYRWAVDNAVTDPSMCGGNSDSFIEGCQSYGEAIAERAEEIQEEGY